MNWDAIGAIGQAVSALALFGVFIQVRHAGYEMRRSIMESRMSAGRELNMFRASNERVARIRSKAFAALGEAAVSPADKVLMDKAGLSFEEAEVMFHDQLAGWLAIKTGIAYMDETPDDRAEFEAGIRGTYLYDPVGQLWYESMRDQLHRPTVLYVESVLARSE